MKVSDVLLKAKARLSADQICDALVGFNEEERDFYATRQKELDEAITLAQAMERVVEGVGHFLEGGDLDGALKAYREYEAQHPRGRRNG